MIHQQIVDKQKLINLINEMKSLSEDCKKITKKANEFIVRYNEINEANSLLLNLE